MSETFDPGQTLTAAELNAAFAAVTPPAAGLLGGTGTVFVVVSVGSGLAINSNTLEATGGGGTVTEIVAGAGLNGGTITTSGTISANYQAGTLTAVGAGLEINSGTIVADAQTIVNGGSHFTITPVSGVSNVLINGNNSAATTIDIGPPVYQGQHLRVQYKNGATHQALALGTSIVFGANPSSYTPTAANGESDFLQFIGANGSQWACVALSQGFTV